MPRGAIGWVPGELDSVWEEPEVGNWTGVFRRSNRMGPGGARAVGWGWIEWTWKELDSVQEGTIGWAQMELGQYLEGNDRMGLWELDPCVGGCA